MKDLASKISNLRLHCFYHLSLQKVVVHFFNEKAEKHDIIAYLHSDMSWDVREIIQETSILDDDKETITLSLRKLSVEENGSTFDALVRKGIFEIGKQTYGDETDLYEKDIVFSILNNNHY